uniref:Aspartate aminotransferase n=1 Tax=Parascaris univalens TaxID=6257 RepID=A0A915AGX4_PARUN
MDIIRDLTYEERRKKISISNYFMEPSFVTAEKRIDEIPSGG